MAFGIGKAFKKAWKGTFGKLEDAVDPVKNTLIGAATGFVASGFNPVGAIIGAGAGYAMDSSKRQQEKALNAQIASSEKLAQMQQATVISAAPPTQTSDNAAITEANNATKKARAFRLANSVRGNTLGGGGSSSNKKRTLG